MTTALWGRPILAENSLFHAIGEIFQPLFKLFANILAAIYSVVPNYAIAIALLTVLVMLVLTPLTVKSTKSMIAMQQLQPEIKKLQQKYKGADNREQLNQEMMKLYKEYGVNPAGGCLPMFIQMPFLIVLYDVIRGLTATSPQGKPQPKYVNHGTALYHNLIASGGKMEAFGMNLALKPFSHHGSIWAAIPFFVLVGIAVALQFIQMRQMTRRNPNAAQANPQMQTMQKIMPIIFAYIYFLIPAAVVIYMIVSTIIRIATQDIMFRLGIVAPAGERGLPASGAKGSSGSGGPPAAGRRRGLLGAAAAALGGGERREGNGPALDKAAPDERSGNGNGNGKTPPTGQNGSSGQSSAKANPSGSSRQSGGGKKPGSGSARSAGGQRRPPDGTGPTGSDGTSAQKAHPRSKSKRTRKAR